MYSMQAKSASQMDNTTGNKKLPVKLEPANGRSPPFAAGTGTPFFPHHHQPLMVPSPAVQQFFQRQMGSPPVGAAGTISLGQSSRPPGGSFPSQMLLQLLAAQQNQQQQQQKLWAASSSSSSSSSSGTTANLSGASSSTNSSSASSSAASNHQPLLPSLNNNGFEPLGTPFLHPSSINSTNFPGAFQQQLQHTLLPFLQQQQMQQQQQQQQQLMNPSPKQEQKPQLQQQSPSIDLDPMAQQQQHQHQQLWLHAFALALGAMQQQQQQNASEENTNGDHNKEDNGGGIPLTADKKLKRDSDGNALCPACHLPIGKDIAQWAKHLEFERAKLQKAYQSLKERALLDFSKTLKSPTIVTGVGQQQHQMPGSEDEEENEQRNNNKQQRDSLLERIRANQRHRIDAKLRGHFFTASLSLAHNIVFDEQNQQQQQQQRRRSNGPSPQSTTTKGDDYLHTNGTKKENSEEQKLHQHNHNGHPAETLTSVHQPPSAPLQNGNSQPLLMTASRKRVSPSFSALELAEPSSCAMATDGRNSGEDKCEYEEFQQKRPKLEAGDLMMIKEEGQLS